MQLTETDKGLLATLRDNPAFVLLVGLFKEHEDVVLGALAVEGDQAELLRKASYYQFARRVREFLQSRPEAAYDELTTLAETVEQRRLTRAEMEADVFRRRFGNGAW